MTLTFELDFDRVKWTSVSNF